MNQKKKAPNQTRAKIPMKAILIAVIIMSVTVLLIWRQTFYRADMMISDLLCQQPSVASKNIYVIAIDDRTLNQYGVITSWDRSLSAELVEKLNANDQAKPAVIGFDIIYSEGGTTQGDEYFANVCINAGNVVVAMNYDFKEMPEIDELGKTFYNPYYVNHVVLPYETLRNSCNYGFANTLIGTDGFVRRAMAYVEDNNTKCNSFATEIYTMYQHNQGKEAILPKLDRNHQYLFSYSGKSGCYSTISMVDVMNGNVDTRIFKDSIVLIGAYAVGMQDSYTPAISHGNMMYGVEIQGNIIEALLEGNTQQTVASGVYAIIVGFLSASFYLILKKTKIITATITLIISIIVEVILIKVLYINGWVIPTVVLPIAFMIIYVATLVSNYIEEIMRRKKVINVLKQYVAPQVVDKISKEKDLKLVLGGENRHIACLFVDIRGFTSMSESLKPEEVVEILNEYLSLTTKSIFDNGGTLDKFIGDATMAVFNAPFDLEDYIYKAVKAAWDMKAGADAIAKKFEQKYGKSVAFGIGVNCGNAVVGNIGCDFRMDYTAIGDTVNTASRLESNAKRGQILISDAVYLAVKDRVEVTLIGDIPLKGKTQGVTVYQVDEVSE